MDIIYSTSPVQGVKGRKNTKAVNPIYFVEPEEGATTVYLNGEYPKIAKAYQERGVTVKPLSDLPGQPKPAAESGDQKGA